MRIEIVPVTELPEITEGDDLTELIATHSTLHDGDVVVIAQKIVSKAEGRLVPIDPSRREEERARTVSEESVRVVARRGDTVIAQTRHGFVCANAGVDASNVPPDRLALLPLDPDGSARALRDGLRARGKDVGVIISDTFGRPWRIGQTNVALGVAGIRAARDHRGEKDAYGMELDATIIAIADEIAGAAELVMGKSEGIPVAIVRGMEGVAGEGTAAELIRPADEDMFPAGGVEVLEMRRSVRVFADREVPAGLIERAVAAAVTAPAPHGSRNPRPWRFVWLRSRPARDALLIELRTAWETDLKKDGVEPRTIARRIGRSEELLGSAPVVLACFVSLAGADRYDDERRARAEREMFVASAGAAVQNLMVALAAEAIGSCWVSSSLFAPDAAARALRLGPEWLAVGCVAAGFPAKGPKPRPPLDQGDFLDVR